MNSKLPASKADLEAAMKSNVDAIEETERALKEELLSTKTEIIRAIDRIEKLYDVDRRLKTVETKLGISVA